MRFAFCQHRQLLTVCRPTRWALATNGWRAFGHGTPSWPHAKEVRPMRTYERVAQALGGGERGLAALIAFTFLAVVFSLAVLA